mmetsp:Transcript_36400/g.100243  ORF Transcript_36400/g.100243 Transcript_36400/m.100243 type:complete len:121 (-) Transcript_36400:143-505(-)
MSDDEEEEVIDPQAQALANLPKYVVRKLEIREDLFKKMLLLTVDSLKKHKHQKDVAQEIKQTLDKEPEFNELIGKGPWQVIVGRSFSASVTYESMHIAFFDIPKYQESILIYKSLGVQCL